MKSGPTEKPKEKKTVVSETVNRKNGRNPKLDHNEWWEKLMMELGSGESAGTDTSAMEPVISSGLVERRYLGKQKKGHCTRIGRFCKKKDEWQAAQGFAGGVP